jgi:hypothetical protein
VNNLEKKQKIRESKPTTSKRRKKVKQKYFFRPSVLKKKGLHFEKFYRKKGKKVYFFSFESLVLLWPCQWQVTKDKYNSD